MSFLPSVLYYCTLSSQVVLVVKNNTGDMKDPIEGNGNLLQDSYLENPMEREA